MTTFRNVVISERSQFFFYILFKTEEMGINLCKGLLDSPKHINSQWKTLSMRQVPVEKTREMEDGEGYDSVEKKFPSLTRYFTIQCAYFNSP